MIDSTPARLFRAVLGTLLLFSMPVSAQVQAPAQVQASSPDQALFDFSPSPDNLLISYSETPEMLANPDLTPRVQVFGDGLVWVHYPEYMKKAGDYGLYLNASELQSLMQDMSVIFDFDPQDTMQARETVEDNRGAAEDIIFHSDGTAERLVVQLDSYQTTQAAANIGIDLDITWKNISADAMEFPEVSALQQLAAAKQSIQTLLERDDLVRLDAAPTRN